MHIKEPVARGRKSCWVRELQSLVGSLQHACKVVHPGLTFMCRMHELLSGAKRGRIICASTRISGQMWNGGTHSYPLGMAFPCSADFGWTPLMWNCASGSLGCGRLVVAASVDARKQVGSGFNSSKGISPHSTC